MTNFTKGEIVRLNSGGPKMTVLATKGNKITCQWFDRNGKMHKSDFDSEMVSQFIASSPREW